MTVSSNPMTIVERLFTEIKREQVHEYEAPKPLSTYFGKPAIVVLGDPGAGKTTSFNEAVKAEPNSEYVSIRDFLTLSINRWRNKVLYLDGLDEQRAKTKDGAAALDKIRAKLDELGCPSFRLSCRAADWFGSSDIERLAMVSQDKSVTALTLEPLTHQDIVTIAGEMLPNAGLFIEEARQRGIYELLTNPQTLKLILAVVIEKGDWPRTRIELYEHACVILAKESNEEHTGVLPSDVNTDLILSSAGYLSAIILCSGAEGIALAEKALARTFHS